jgi:polyhydroxyalkanoate synthesis regulator phasin
MTELVKGLCIGFVAVAEFVYILLRGQIQAAEAKRAVEELKRRYAENQLEVHKKNSGKSSDDIIDEHIKRSGKS